MKRVLLIETSATLRHAAKKLLETSGYQVAEISSFSEGLTQIAGLDNGNEWPP